jgi:hypothetical protein
VPGRSPPEGGASPAGRRIGTVRAPDRRTPTFEA